MLTMSDNCPSRFTLVRFHKDRVTDPEKKQIASHLLACPACPAVLRNICDNEAAYEAGMPGHNERLRAALEREPARVGIRRHVAITISALAVVALLALGAGLYRWTQRNDVADVAFKGNLAVKVTIRRGDGVFELTDGKAAPSDAMRFTITTAAPGYLRVLLIDGAGGVMVLYPDPADGGDWLFLDGPGEHLLPGSIVLDSARSDYRLLVALAKREQHLDNSAILRAADTGTALPDDTMIEVVSFTTSP